MYARRINLNAQPVKGAAGVTVMPAIKGTVGKPGPVESKQPNIVKTVRTLLSTYDVTDEHLCINERGNKLKDVFYREPVKTLGAKCQKWVSKG